MVALNQQWAEEVFSESAIGATQTGDGAALPFSFVYGGQHSSSLVGAWECQVQDETVDATHDEPSPPVKMSGAAGSLAIFWLSQAGFVFKTRKGKIIYICTQRTPAAHGNSVQGSRPKAASWPATSLRPSSSSLARVGRPLDRSQPRRS